MSKLSEIYKHNNETLKRLNEAYWYLRDGDLLPEKVAMFMDGKGITQFTQLDMLDEAGNLFVSKEEALAVSRAVRAFLFLLNTNHIKAIGYE